MERKRGWRTSQERQIKARAISDEFFYQAGKTGELEKREKGRKCTGKKELL